MTPLVRRFTGPIFVLVLIVSSHSPMAETPVLSGETLEEELKWLRAELNVEVTSIFKKPQRLFTAPAAVFVLTREEIRRSAATNIPDLLRLVPGMHVANVTSSLRAIASRGFNDRLTDKLLVLIDGRPVYRATFSGVSWEVENYPLEDIERIEVIRGPGSTVWGANAVNGVINILTRDSAKTVGGYLKGAIGTEQEVAGTLSYSFDLNENTSLRLFGNGSQNDSMALSQNAQGIDDWYFAQGGFRMDADFDESRFSLQGQYADSDTGTLTDIIDPGFPPTFFRASDDDIQFSLGHLMGRYDYSFDEDHDLTFQLFYDYFDLRTENITRFRIHTVDTEFQHRSPLGDRQEVIFGIGYRYYPITSGSNAAPAFQITDAERHDQLFSFFVQDEIKVVEDTLHLTVGTKVEYQDIIDSWEFMPQARLAWMPDETQTYWASISRAVRSPSFINVGIDGILPSKPLEPDPRLPAPLNALNTFFRREISVNKPKAEDVLGIELGLRIQPSEDTSLDLAAFLTSLMTSSLYDLTLTRRLFRCRPARSLSFRFHSLRTMTWKAKATASKSPAIGKYPMPGA